jgi:hypothetical protein
MVLEFRPRAIFAVRPLVEGRTKGGCEPFFARGQHVAVSRVQDERRFVGGEQADQIKELLQFGYRCAKRFGPLFVPGPRW